MGQRPTIPLYLPSVTRYSAPYKGYLPHQTNDYLPLSRPEPYLWKKWPLQYACHRLESPSLCSPTSRLLPTAISSAPPSWHTERWWHAAHSGHSRAPPCRTVGTVGGGVLTPPVWSPCPWHVGVGIVPSSMYALTPIPDTSWLDSSLGPPRLKRLSCKFVALLRENWSTIAVPLLMIYHSASIDVLPATPMPIPTHTPNTPPRLSVSPGMIYPLPSSTDRTPPLTGYLLPDRDRIPFWLSYQYFSLVPLDWKYRPGYQPPPAAIPGLMMLPYHHPCRRGRFGVIPPVRALPVTPIFLPPLIPSVGTLHTPPNWIWWGTEGSTASPPGIPGTLYFITPLSALPSAAYPSIPRGYGGLEDPHHIPPVFPVICTCTRHHKTCTCP